MHIWDEKVPPEDARQIGARLLATSPLFARIESETLTRCLYWVVSLDCESKSDAKDKATAKCGSVPRDLRDHARKIEGLAYKAEHLTLVRLFPAPPFGIPEMLRSYAKQLRQTAEYKTRMMEGRTGWRSKSGTEALCFLVQTVREKTGRPQFQQIADLLTEASRLLGVATQYDPDAIKMRIHRKGRPAS